MSISISVAYVAEIERLRHDIERHIAIASELATENERLRAELAKADGQINRCVEQNKYLESTISRLRDENKAAWDSAEYNARRARVAEAAIKKLLAFAEHDAECQGQPGYDIPCSCGYDELMKELEESK